MIARRRALVASLLAAAAFAIYLTNVREMKTGDSLPTRLLPFSLLREGNFDLDEFDWLRRPRRPYFLTQTRSGHWVSTYPAATSILATPVYVPAVWWLSANRVEDDDVRFRLVAVVTERVAAALIAATSVALLFLALCSIVSTGMSASVALAYALGTNTWATSSQALWQHGPVELCLAGMSLFLLRAPTGWNGLGAGIFAAFGLAVRPTFGIFWLLALLFVALHRRRAILPFLAPVAAAAAALLAYNLVHFGGLRGGYAPGALVPDPKNLLALLISPNRGLFVFTPVAILALPVLLRGGAGGPPWLRYLAAGIGGYILFYSSFHSWWGGYCYGPRYLEDVLPALALCAAPTAERLWSLGRGRALIAAAVALSVAVQLVGVYLDDGSWNGDPVSIDRDPGRAWSWSDPQILRAARSGWHGTDLLAQLRQLATDPRPAFLRPLSENDLAGEITATASRPLHLAAGDTSQLTVRVENRGGAVWPSYADFGYLDVALVASIGDDVATSALPFNLGPGEAVAVPVEINAPERRGAAELTIRLIQVKSARTGGFGGAELRLPVVVE